MRPQDAGAYVGYAILLERMVKAGWLKPVVHRRKMILYDIRDLDRACDRIASGEFPGDDSSLVE